MSDEKEWWHPIKGGDEGLDWLCDHVGDANDVMNTMWKILCDLDPELPKDGWDGEDEE